MFVPEQIVWARDENALWYHLWVGASDYSDVVFYNWVDATDTCDDSTCTLDVSELTFAEVEHEIWTEAWGSGGYITWTQVNGGVPNTFTVTGLPIR